MAFAKHNKPVFFTPGNKHAQTMLGLSEELHSKIATEQHC